MRSFCVGRVFESHRDGLFVIKSIKNAREVVIEFIETGCKRVVEAGNAKKGYVKDLLLPRVFGVGFVGIGQYSKKSDPKAYQTWHNMLQRCYYEKTLKDKPTYADCYVDSSWHDFQGFAKWFNDNYINDLHLDKDIKIKGNKVYSAEACIFVTLAENNIDSHAKSYNLISPDGEKFEVYNLKAFCREKNLTSANIHKVVSGERKHHKQWTSQTN